MSTEQFLSTRTYKLEALTDVWTGDATTAQSKAARRLITTGVLGSIRWWFEVLVRGLGGAPCDPSTNQKACIDKDHCVVCELFGCTGWARKVRFDVREEGGAVIQSQIRKGATFQLRFTPLRSVRAQEWALLELTLRLICQFGALGGKTVLKPSDQNSKPQHADLGLVGWRDAVSRTHIQAELATYVHGWSKKPTVPGAAWASLLHMWVVNGEYLTRQNQYTSTFNRVIGRPEEKSKSSSGDSWLAGRQGESKKVFSFRAPARTFGFVQRVGDLGVTRETLRAVWSLPAAHSDWFVCGDALLGRLFAAKEAVR